MSCMENVISQRWMNKKKPPGGQGSNFPVAEEYGHAFNLKNDKCHNCKKTYNILSRHSPGLLTVQCVRKHPKILGFIVMPQAEPIAMALSSELTHSRIPPRVIYFDIACNMLPSVVLRLTHLAAFQRFIMDCFHFKSHRCSGQHDADRYPRMDHTRTTSAESFNVRLKDGLC